MAGCTSAPMRAHELFSADQWIGTNSVPRCCPRLTSTRSDGRAVLRRDARQRALHQPHARGIVGVDLRERLGDVASERRGESPVRVMVCHWSRTRPVLSTNGHASRDGGGKARLGDGHEAGLAVAA